MSTSFKALSISEPLLEVLLERRIETPSPVQSEAIPAIMSGRDLLAESPTGSGKTLAYLLPICTKLEVQSKELQALILAPTHELVMQIFREAEPLLEKLGLSAAALIGGVNIQRQLEKLKSHPALVVATPGRLKELLDMKKIKVHTVKTVVVDEADRMMDRGFANTVQEVLRRLMRDTQRLFLSATLPEHMVNFIKPMVHDPVMIKSKPPEQKHEVLHFYLVSELRNKVDTLRRLVRLVNAQSTIVFVNTIDKADQIIDKLKYHHLECRLLHRETSKEERALTLQQFRDRKFPVLIATDVAARGIDIPGVECIVHFDPATDADAYIHRSGRTGRMGATGLVFSIITPQEKFIVEKFTKATKIPIVQKEMEYGALIDPAERRQRTVRNKPTRAGKASTTKATAKQTNVKRSTLKRGQT